ncbi:MAG: 3'-5' exoribonuclease [Chloroflexi bacterium]|nr:3'-5' exoribonuclease [Chloroflexota bacterium]
MTRTFVALDLETTGLELDDRITEVGAVRFDEAGTILATFDQLVNPEREIPRFVEQLTGISNAAVACAPKLAEVAPQLRAFVAGDVIVGQNVRFDVGHLRRAGIDMGAPAVDTTELSRLLMPDRQPRGLMDLAAALGVEAGEHHRALPDARTAADIFVALLRRAREIPRDQRAQLARLIALQDLPLAEIIAGEEWESLPATERSLPTVTPPPEYATLTKREPRQPVLAGEVTRAFNAAAGGAIERFEERPEQREMAEAVRRAMTEGGHWLIEAGTGVGKSLAYLVPAALHAIRNGERVVISTNTIALQEQLLRKDIPALRRTLVASGAIKDESELRASLLKGRANYLCLRRWVASYGAGMADPDFARLAASMLLWLPKTLTGDRGELNFDHNDYVTWQRFSAQDTDCLSRQTSYVREGKCFLQRARKSAESAHILVVNHALLLADVASGGNALPAFDHLVIDEAHNLEDQATKQFGGSVSRRVLADALEGLHRRGGRDQREGGVVTLLKAFPEGAATLAGVPLEQSVARAVSMLPACFEALAAHLPRGGDDDRVLLDRSLRAQPGWTAVELAWTELDKALRDVIGRAGLAMKAVTDHKLVEEPDAIAGEIESASRKVDDLRALLEQLMSTTDDSTITWLGREREGTASVNSAPLDVGPRLWEELFAKRRTVIATSATLSAAGSMDYAARRMGLESPRTLQLGSPYDYEASTLLAALTDVPEPNAPGFNDASAEAIVQLVKASEGRALALFTSHAALRYVASRVRAPLEAEGINVLAQGVDGEPRQLTENLANTPRTLVLGTQSFWEGVDIRGDALSMLIIVKLPFPVPSDPVHRARSEQYDSPFGQYSLPAAILKFRQGFGRLIRDREDRGVVAVLDRRVFEKSYGKQFVSALPPCTRIRATAEVVAERTREWLGEA